MLFDKLSNGLNSMSIRHNLTKKPPLLYNCATDSSDSNNCLAVRLGRNSTVFSLMS
jgi:hypothetical protein